MNFRDSSDNKRIAILLHTNSFEDFYVKQLGLSYDAYIRNYRNEWSWDYAAGLARHKISTFIYVLSYSRNDTYQTEEGVTIRFLPYSYGHQLWLKLAYFFRKPVGRYLADIINTKLFYPYLSRSLLVDSIDLLYIQEYWTGRFDFLVSRLDLPIIAGDHGGRGDGQFKWGKRRAFAAVDKITSQTPSELAEVRSYGADAVLLTNSVDTEFYKPSHNAKRSAKTILVVARFTDYQKRISDLINALVYLDAEWELQIAGSGPDEALYRELIAQLKLEDRVRFLGFVEDKNFLLSLYQECGVFALTSSWEGLPFVVLEAMSSEAAVVVTDIRAYEGLINEGKNGVKVRVGDVKGIAERIVIAFENRQALGKAARATVRAHFSRRAVFEKLAMLIRECTDKV